MNRGKTRGFSSIKNSSSSIKSRGIKVKGNMNLGSLLTKYPKIDELLYSYTTHSEWIYDDMDFSIEEFSDITGADLDELLTELTKVMKG